MVDIWYRIVNSKTLKPSSGTLGMWTLAADDAFLPVIGDTGYRYQVSTKMPECQSCTDPAYQGIGYQCMLRHGHLEDKHHWYNSDKSIIISWTTDGERKST